jgi:hypothetical protein
MRSGYQNGKTIITAETQRRREERAGRVCRRSEHYTIPRIGAQRKQREALGWRPAGRLDIEVF